MTSLFDEAGARGMLLNNLPTQKNQLIVLDSKESDGTFVRSEAEKIASN